MFFMGGPCTIGPGKIVSEEHKDTIRSHHDLNKEIAKHVHKATKVVSTSFNVI
jgi:protein transport protein SEC23